MPYQRKNSAAKQPAKRRSKLAKENDISADEEAEIREAFDLFASQDDEKDGRISRNDVRRCLIALNAPPANNADLQELLEVADPENAGWVPFEHFLPVAALQLNRAKGDEDEERQQEEVDKAYNLFVKGQDRPITIADLKRISKELREDVPDNVLKDMIREATGGSLGGVGKEDFESVMRRAGVFG
ncbi:uncharacterized protein MYCFIDRAFT_186232 [Pseudocercospora fijiensis CIRAD86]|uniref:Calmodulin n=1 Tax=Pseudocercospora fijiensis (strain CIRAD86) TaxID=383855 RepID=M3B8S0_PSEFD|nr:uncharacterized protein MYCFIDRAFT_186232 [Pseudocercospora fijiensis CIRAD86]EME85727.1 hypothetical protein MYCFIDRAFT_186232 [Pseudocercospora fijiensis CIRAD86]